MFLYYTLKYSFLKYRCKDWGTLSAPLWCEPRTRPRLRRHSVIHCVLKVLIQHDSGDEFCVNFCNSGKFKFVSKYWFSYFRASDKPSGELVWTDLQPCIHILSLKHIYLQLFQHCHLGINKNQLGVVLKVFHQEMQFKKFIIDRWVGRGDGSLSRQGEPSAMLQSPVIDIFRNSRFHFYSCFCRIRLIFK